MLSFIFYFDFISLLISQSLMDFMSFVVILSVLWLARKSKSTSLFFPSRLEALWPFWIFIFILGLALNHQGNQSWWPRLRELHWILNFYFFLWFFAFMKPWENSRPWNWVWNFLGAFSLMAFVGWKLDLDFSRWGPLSDPGRAGGLFDDPMTFAHVYGCFFLLVFSLSLGVFETSKKFCKSRENLSLIFSSLLTGAAVFVSFTRGIWIGAAAAVVAVSFLHRPNWGLRALSTVAAGFAILFLVWEKFQDRVLFVFRGVGGYDGERIWLWKANLRMFLDHPWIGIGYGEYKIRLREYFDLLGAPQGQLESHAHNQYLHFLAGTGALGLLCYLIFTGFVFYKSTKLCLNLRRQFFSMASPVDDSQKTKIHFPYFLSLGLWGGQIVFLVGGLTESNFERAKIRWTYLTFCALALAMARIYCGNGKTTLKGASSD